MLHNLHNPAQYDTVCQIPVEIHFALQWSVIIKIFKYSKFIMYTDDANILITGNNLTEIEIKLTRLLKASKTGLLLTGFL